MQFLCTRTAFIVLAALIAVVTACGGGEEDVVDRYANARQRVFHVVCECGTGGPHCDVEEFDECERAVLRRHLNGTAALLECGAASLEQQETCFHEAGCTTAAAECFPPVFTGSDCSEHGTDEFDAAVEEMLRECLKSIRCEDRTTVRGRYCNEEPECSDESDETACGPLRGVFGCSDGTWLERRFACDGVDDCSDGEDESCDGAAGPAP